MGAVKTKVAKSMHAAILHDDLDKLKEILDKYPDAANCSLSDGQTNPMCRAAYLGKQDIALLLLKYNADVNFPSQKSGNTPLMWAAWRNKVEMVNFLLDLKADPEIINHKGDSPLDVCIKRISYQ